MWAQAISDFFESVEIRIKHDPSRPEWLKLNWSRWLFKVQNRLAISSVALTSLSLSPVLSYFSFLCTVAKHYKKNHAKTKNMDFIDSYTKQTGSTRNPVTKYILRGQVIWIVNKA